MTEQREESYSPTGRGLRSLVLASLLAGASGWCAAQDAGKATCRENGALRICAEIGRASCRERVSLNV